MGHFPVQVEIDIANEESEETSRDYAAAALPVLFPLVTGCMLKQVRAWAVRLFVCV